MLSVAGRTETMRETHLGAGGVQLRSHLVRKYGTVGQPRFAARHAQVVQGVWVTRVERQRPLVQPNAAFWIAYMAQVATLSDVKDTDTLQDVQMLTGTC